MSGRPPSRCSTFGTDDFIRVPWPAARTMTASRLSVMGLFSPTGLSERAEKHERDFAVGSPLVRQVPGILFDHARPQRSAQLGGDDPRVPWTAWTVADGDFDLRVLEQVHVPVGMPRTAA